MTYDAGSAKATYDLDYSGFERGARAVVGLYAQMRKAAEDVTRTQSRSGSGGSGPGSANDQRANAAAIRQSQQLERQLRRQADAQIQAARATGEYDRALELVNREMQVAENDLVRYNQLLTRRAQIERQVAQTSRGAAPAAPTVPAGSGGGAISAIGSLAAGGAAVAGTIGFAQGTAEAARYGQQLLQIEKRFNELAKTGGSTGDQLLQALRSVSGNQISDANLRLTATRAAVQGVGDSAAELAPLLAIAADRSQALGLDTTQAFNDLVEGIAKAEPEILDNLGITLNLTQVYADYSAQLGKTANDLTVTEKRTALLNAVLKQAGDIKPPDPNPYERVATAITNIGDRASTTVAQGLKPLAETLAGGLEGILAGTSEGIADAAQSLIFLQGQARPATQAERDFAAAVAERLGFQREATAATIASTQATVQETQAIQSAAEAQRAQNVTLAEAIALGQQKQLEDQAQAEIQEVLNEAVIRVVTGQSTQAEEVARLTALYPELAAQADPLIAQQLRLAAASDEVALAIRRQRQAEGDARLDAQREQTRDQSGSIGFDSPGRQGSGDVDAVVAAIEDQKRAQAQEERDRKAAQDRLVRQQETTAQRVARLRREEAAALAQQGKQSSAYLNAQYERIEAEEQLAAEQERLSKKGLSGAQRDARASATLLDGIENREQDHYRKRLQQQEDFQRDARRSQEDFELGRARDQEDFERQRRKLLAEGKIAEAQQLTEEFTREQAREAEDFNRRRQREQEDYGTRAAREDLDLGLDTQRKLDRAAIRGVAVPGAGGASAAAPDVTRGVVPASAPGFASGGGVAGSGGARLAIQLTPAPVTLDGQTIATVVYPYIEIMIGEDLSITQLASPAQTSAVQAVGGPRPI